MLRRSDWNVIFGPPGTGKTTACMNEISKLLDEGISPSSIGYIAFTKKAATEARVRAASKFGFKKDDMPYFRTIHSLCFMQLGILPQQMIQKSHYRQLGDMLGIEIGGSKMNEDVYSMSMPVGDRLLFLDNLSRITKTSLEDIYDSVVDDDFNLEELILVSKSLKKYKEKMRLLDFTDLLELYEDHGIIPKLHTLIVDEAQDLSKLQWQVVHRVASNSDYVFAAGDDDQAIYRWAGASVEDFIKLEGNKKVLDQSYRVPQEVHKVATDLLSYIKNRVVKIFKPSQTKGEVHHHFSVDDIDMSKGTWLCLARNSFLLREYERVCEINGWEYDRIGFKEDSGRIPRILISTIHGVKGGEADHVAIMTDMASRSYKYMERYPDDEHRVFYVALTRAKQSIHIIQPKGRIYYEI